MTIAPEILAAQQAYAARPWFVMWRDSHCQVPQRFNTAAEAFEYVDYQWKKIRDRVARERYNASRLGGYLGSYIEGPGLGRVSLRYVLLAEDVSSY